MSSTFNESPHLQELVMTSYDLKTELVFLSPAVSFLLLLPGLNQHGVITKYASMAKREINKLLKQKEKKNE